MKKFRKNCNLTWEWEGVGGL